jgi:hypothetical protein
MGEVYPASDTLLLHEVALLETAADIVLVDGMLQ